MDTIVILTYVIRKVKSAMCRWPLKQAIFFICIKACRDVVLVGSKTHSFVEMLRFDRVNGIIRRFIKEASCIAGIPARTDQVLLSGICCLALSDVLHAQTN